MITKKKCFQFPVVVAFAIVTAVGCGGSAEDGSGNGSGGTSASGGSGATGTGGTSASGGSGATGTGGDIGLGGGSGGEPPWIPCPDELPPPGAECPDVDTIFNDCYYDDPCSSGETIAIYCVGGLWDTSLETGKCLECVNATKACPAAEPTVGDDCDPCAIPAAGCPFDSCASGGSISTATCDPATKKWVTTISGC